MARAIHVTAEIGEGGYPHVIQPVRMFGDWADGRTSGGYPEIATTDAGGRHEQFAGAAICDAGVRLFGVAAADSSVYRFAAASIPRQNQ